MEFADVILVLLIGAGIVALGFLAVRESRRLRNPADERIARATSLGMSVGMLLGAALGVVVWMSTGEFVFWVIFMGAGMTVGMAAGHGIAVRSR